MPLPDDFQTLVDPLIIKEIMEKYEVGKMRVHVMNRPLTLNSLLPILKAIGLIDDDFNESELIDKLLNIPNPRGDIMHTWLDYFFVYDFHGTEHLCYTGFLFGIDPYKFINKPTRC